jgi:hypothetical protein
MKNNTKGLDKKHSLGRGILILTKIGYQVEQIFPTWNSDRRAFSMVTYENGKQTNTGSITPRYLRKKRRNHKISNYSRLPIKNILRIGHLYIRGS